MNQLNTTVFLFALALGNAWAAGFEGNFNTKLGKGAGSAAGDDDYSVFIGRYAGISNTSGFDNTFLGDLVGYSNTTGSNNTFLGSLAGYSTTTGNKNVFIGNAAGYDNTTGFANTFLGYSAGSRNTSGQDNTFVGYWAGDGNNSGSFNTYLGMSAGEKNTDGFGNLFLGYHAGFNNTIGSGNVFLGASAGLNETGSSRLYIANSATSTPLIYGEFGNQIVTLNGNLSVVGPNAGLVRLTDVTTNTTTKGARLVLNHYNNASLPVYLFGAASTSGNNFVAFGGGNAIGNAATQLDFFTGPTTTTATGTSRMTINGAGNIGMGVTAPAHPLHMASGALVTAGGVWTNASSRDYKENIRSLSTKEAALTLASLTPVTYNYKADKGQGHVGFIAEDVPELVATKDRKGLSPMDIVAVLTKVTQEQQRAIEEHQKLAQAQQKMMESYQQQAEEQARVNEEHLKMVQEQQRVTQAQKELIAKLSTELTTLKDGVRLGTTTSMVNY